MSAGDRDGHVGHEHAWSVYLVAGDPVADSGVHAAHASHGPDRGASAQKFRQRVGFAHAVHRVSCDGVAHQDADELGIVCLFLFRFSGSGEVDVQVDESGQQITPCEIDGLVSFRSLAVAAYAGDPVAVNEHRHTGPRGHVPGPVQKDAVAVSYHFLLNSLPFIVNRAARRLQAKESPNESRERRYFWHRQKITNYYKLCFDLQKPEKRGSVTDKVFDTGVFMA